MFYYLLYRIGQFLVLRLPLQLSYRIAVFIADIRYSLSFKDRNNVKDNIRNIFPDKTEKEVDAISRGVFRNFAKYLVDFLNFPRIDKEYIMREVKLENTDFFNEVLSNKKGSIVLTAHLGNWELGGAAISLLGYPFAAVAMEHKYKKTNDLFRGQRESKGIKVIPLRRAAWQALRCIKDNSLLALVGDIDYGGKTVLTDFFGKPALLPSGPATMVLKTGVPLVLGFMIRNKDDTFTLRIEKPIDLSHEASAGIEDPLVVINRYKGILERYIRQYPDQWYMFRKFAIKR